MVSRASKPRTIREVCADIRKEYFHWKDLYHHGCSDPSWCDGTNLNLVRNHIFYYLKELEKICGDKFFLYPDEYYWPVPPEVPNDYMAVDRNLACRGFYKATERPYKIAW